MGGFRETPVSRKRTARLRGAEKPFTKRMHHLGGTDVTELKAITHSIIRQEEVRTLEVWTGLTSRNEWTSELTEDGTSLRS